MERALVLVKPDGVERGLVGRVISRFETAGLKVIAIKMVKASREMAGKHYIDDDEWLLSVGKKTKQSYVEKGIKSTKTEREIGLWVRSMLMDEITRIPVVAIVFEGNSANEVARKIAGATEPRKADPASIRGTYSCDSYAAADNSKRPVRNIVHVSESSVAAEREMKVWFGKQELQSYRRADEDIMYK
jgi:nucleoside-diphosphate kinase